MLKQFFRNSFFIIVSFFLVAAMSAHGGPEKGKREPIVITSRRMQADKLGDKVTFTGDVTLKKEGMTLNSDSMVVFYDVTTKGIKDIEASGNVVVRKEGRVALSNKAFYDSREEKIVLTGDARIIENENQLGGEKITLFMRDDRSIVEGGKVLFYQDKQVEVKKRR
jgi:lipopolysaccharide export system protein LptA